MKKLFTYLVVVLVFTGSCKKPPITDESNAIFFFEGTVDGQSVDIRAGDNQYFMFTSFDDDSLRIRSFNGALGKINCVGEEFCPGQVQISLREKEFNSDGRLPIEENVQIGSYLVRGPAENFFTSYKATFISKSSPANAFHVWNFGDGTFSNDVNPVHLYFNEKDSIVTPSLVINNSGNCNSTIEYQVNFASDCEVDFTPTFINHVLKWYPFPKIDRSELWDLTHGYLPLGPGNLPPTDSVFMACVRSTDLITGCVSYKCKNVVLDTQAVACVANFDISKEAIFTEDIRDYSEVSIFWESESGKKYSSLSFEQPLESTFEIIQVDSYLPNAEGHPTKKVAVKFNLRLFGDTELDFVDIQTEKSVFAIAYQ